ncbi:MAG: amidohydrolase family protein [Nitrospirae bacterium]|nr:amidohydrolase family protein [Nitrospirota bacterium]
MIITARRFYPVTRPVIEHGALVIDGSRIVDIGDRRAILRKYPGQVVTDLGMRSAMPGLVNVHTHLELSHLQGLLGEHERFFDWITALVDARRTHGMRGAKKPATAALGQVISSGTTCVGDIAATKTALPAIIKSGIRAVSFQEVIGLDEGMAEGAFAGLMVRLEAAGRLISRTGGRLRSGISPHSTYSVSDLLYRQLADYISSNSSDICIHMSESYDELLSMCGSPSGMDSYMERYGWDRHPRNRARSPVEFARLAGVYKGLLAVHCVHVSKSDMKTLKAAGASVAHCPRSNHFLNVGRAPVEEMLAMGINVALGTDSLTSNIDLDLWEEMRFAYLVNRLNAEQVIAMGTINGAKALGFGDVAGSLEPGKDADIVAVEEIDTGWKDPHQALLLGAHRENIALTMVQGSIIHMKEGLRYETGL